MDLSKIKVKINIKKLNIKKYIAITVFSSILISSVISGVYALQVDNPQYKPLNIHPGDDVDLWFKITNNNYNNNVKNIRITITPHYPFEIKQVNSIKGTYTISHLNPGESDTAYFKLHVNENAPSRDYRIDVKVSYDEVENENGEDITRHYEWTKPYYLHVYGIANFEINAENITLTPAKTKIIPITLYNKGTGTAKQCTLTIGGNNCISPIDTTKFYVGSIEANEGKIINLKLYANEKTPEGAYLIPATVSWIDEDGTPKTENINIGLLVQGDVLLGISNVITTPKEIKPGDTYVRIDTTITNNGHGEAKDINVHLKTEYPFKDSWSNANYKDIGTLSGSESKEVSFTIDVDKNAPPKHYKIPIEIEYLDIFNKKHNITKTIDIYIKPKPILEIIPKEYDLKAGTENTLLIHVKNAGNEKAEYVKITAIKNSAQPFDYPTKSDTVGTLKPGENGTGAIVIDVDKNAVAKDYIITVEIRAVGDKDEGDDNVYITQKSIKVKVENNSTSYLPFGIGLMIILVIVGLYYYKRKNKDE
ncbi:COG1361 S-layer family protein [Methanothermococcus sp.]|uniref:COG1361 S-layer family protein n=1 Tax=Methanothermococcus sp. TaxID=2614238 RepID=UPI0025F04034|nr:COG1361 S-layer family protein [Methanothermococcus sp.]